MLLGLLRSLTPPDAQGGDTRPSDEERLPFTVIGTEAGFLTSPVMRDQLLLGPADRFDVIFDFSSGCNSSPTLVTLLLV
jgi:FtsP/CotA-like multicopper oxidase with cupredoxin domain